MTDLDPVSMGIGLLGGLAIFLYGMGKMTDGLKAAAGERMNTLLAKLTRNPVSGALTGALVTAVIQSSSVTTVLVVGFVSAGLMTLAQSIGIIFGANVGTTITAQIVAFNVTAAALPMITVGFAMDFLSKSGRTRHYGDMLMGLGLIFLGMAMMGDAMAPLRTHAGFAEFMQTLERPVLGLLVGALFTALVQSSSATISLAVVMATQGLIALPAGIALVFGAKIGTCVTAVLAALGKPRTSQRAAAVHVLYNVLGATLWLPLIPWLAQLATWVSPDAAHLTGTERLAEEVPRQIANAATLWACGNVLIFLPFTALFARMAERLVADRPEDETQTVQPRYLDEGLIEVSSVALERARLELGHLAELAREMLEGFRAAVRERETATLRRQHEQVIELRQAILAYLQRVGRGSLSDEESDELARLVAATSEIEALSGVLGHELVGVVEGFHGAEVNLGDTTRGLVDQLYDVTAEVARSALEALVEQDERVARQVLARRQELWQLGAQLLQNQAERLARDDPQRLLKHRLQVDVLDKLRRIQSLSEHMSLSVLPRDAVLDEQPASSAKTTATEA